MSVRSEPVSDDVDGVEEGSGAGDEVECDDYRLDGTIGVGSVGLVVGEEGGDSF